ncbi:MAG: hypothetical protein V3S12_02450 [Acidiferrobacterales bacterium]
MRPWPTSEILRKFLLNHGYCVLENARCDKVTMNQTPGTWFCHRLSVCWVVLNVDESAHMIDFKELLQPVAP